MYQSSILPYAVITKLLNIALCRMLDLCKIIMSEWKIYLNICWKQNILSNIVIINSKPYCMAYYSVSNSCHEVFFLSHIQLNLIKLNSTTSVMSVLPWLTLLVDGRGRMIDYVFTGFHGNRISDLLHENCVQHTVQSQYRNIILL